MARVIRGGARPPEDAARADAERLRDEARADAEAIRARAISEAEQIREGARAEAREQARAELAAEWLALERSRSAPSAELLTLASAIARRLVEAELTLAPEAIGAIAREALARVPGAQRVRIRAHPDDVAALAALEVAVEADSSIARGGCVVLTELGEVDARLEVRLEALVRAIAASAR
jgi:flagellar biosynthesis/type III secretory pathway protein FliH